MNNKGLVKFDNLIYGMDHLIIAQTEQTPLISFLSNGILEISGKSINQASRAFWHPLILWVESYSSSPATKTHLNLFIESLDTISSSSLLDLLKLLKDISQEGNTVYVYWNYEENDVDMLALGKDLEQLTKIAFEFDVLKPFRLT